MVTRWLQQCFLAHVHLRENKALSPVFVRILSRWHIKLTITPPSWNKSHSLQSDWASLVDMPTPNQSLKRRLELQGWLTWIRTHHWRRVGVSLHCLPWAWGRCGWMLVLDRQSAGIATISDFRGTPQAPGNLSTVIGILKHNHFLGIFLELNSILRSGSCLKSFPPRRTWTLGEREPNTSLSWVRKGDGNSNAKHFTGEAFLANRYQNM